MGEEISQAARNPQPSGGGEQSISNIADEDLRLSDFGVNAGQYLDTIDTIRAYEDPYADTGTSADFEAKHEEWDQGMALDALSGLYNSFVDAGEGIANLAPTVVQALGGEDQEWAEQWKNNVSTFFDAQKVIYSDAANKDINEFGDINSRHIASGLGQAVGFVLGIMGGAGAAGALSKGGMAMSKANSIMKGATKAEKIGAKIGKFATKGKGSIDDVLKKGMSEADQLKYLSKSAGSLGGKVTKAGTKALTISDKLSDAARGANRATRVGSFLTGTAMMYSGVEEEAREAGMSTGDAARFALGVSSLVSMTEGAALEWIGKIGTKGITNRLVKDSLVGGLAKKAAAGSKGNPIAGQKMFMKDLPTLMRNRAANIIEGSAVEAGQTYIEEGAKHLWDVTHKGMGKGDFGADVGSYKTFVESIYGGALGAVIGGAMSGMGGHSLGDQLAKESLFGYINNAEEQNKPMNVGKVKSSYKELFEAGKISEKEYVGGLEEIDRLSSFAKDVKTVDIESGVAKYQLYELDKLRNDTRKVKESQVSLLDENPRVIEAYDKKRKLIETVEESIQENFDSIFDSKDVHSKGREEFQLMTTQYQDLVTAIANGDVDAKEVEAKLKEFSPKNEKTKGRYKESAELDGVEIPSRAMENHEAIVSMAKQVDTKEITQEDFLKAMKTEYDLDEDQVNHILKTEDAVKKFDAALNKKNALDGETEGEDPSSPSGTDSSTSKTMYSEMSDKELSSKVQEMKADVAEEGTDSEFEAARLESIKIAEAEVKAREEAKQQPPVKEPQAKPPAKKSEKERLNKRINKAKTDFSKAKTAEEKVKALLNFSNNSISSKESVSKEDMDWYNEKKKELENDGYVFDGEVGREIADGEIYEKKNVKTSDSIPKGVTVVDTVLKARKIVDGKQTKRAVYDVIEGTGTTAEREALLSKVETLEDSLTTKNMKKVAPELAAARKALKEYDAVNFPALKQEITVEEEVVKEPKSQLEQIKKKSETEIELEEDQFNDDDGVTEIEGDVDEDFDQRKGITESSSLDKKQLIKSNPELYGKIRDFFVKNTKGSVTVREFDGIFDKIGADVLARVSKAGVDINMDSATQTSLIHEFGHIYMELLGVKSPLVQAGLKLMEGTEMHRLAKENYPELSNEGQLKEALTETLAEKTLERLETMFEGSTLDKVKAWLKRFWNRARGVFNSKYYSEIDKMVDEMMKEQSKPVDVSTMFDGYVYQKRMESVDVETGNFIQNSIVKAKANAIIDKKRKIDPNKRNDMRGLVYTDLLRQYKAEKKDDFVGVKILDNVNVSTKGVKPKIVIKENLAEVDAAEKNGEGVNVRRKADTKKHYGNPFTGEFKNNQLQVGPHSKEAVIADETGKLREENKEAALVAYKDWLTGKAWNEVEQKQRAFIRSNVNKGNLDGADLLFYGKGKSHADVLANYVKSKAVNPTKLRAAIKTQAPNVFEITETSIDSVTKSSIISNNEVDELTDIEGSKTNNAIKADKGFSPGIRSIVRALVDHQGKGISPDEVFRYIAGVATNALNVKDLKKQLEKRATSQNVIAERLFNAISSLPEGQQQSIYLEMSSVIQTSYKKAAHQKYKDDAGNTFEKIIIRELNKDFSLEEDVEKAAERLLTWDDTSVIQGSIEGYDGDVSVEGVLSPFQNYANQFTKPDVKVEVDGEVVSLRNVSEKVRNDYNAIVSSLVGHNVPRVVTDSYINEGFYVETEGRFAGKKFSYAHQKIRSLLQGTVAYGNPRSELNPTGWESKKDIRQIMRDSVEDQFLTNSFVNSTGNNVTSTTVGYWITELNKRIFKDEATQKAFSESEIYRNNTILKLAKKQGGKVKWHIHDAIDSNGNAKELSNQSKDDIILTQLMNFANNSNQKIYNQLYGVQGDRGHVTYFEAPRLKSGELKKAYADLAKADRYIFEQWKKESTLDKKSDEYAKALAKYVATYNKSGMNLMSPTGDIYTPFHVADGQIKKYFKNRVGKKVNDISELVKRSKLDGEDNAIGNDHVEANNEHKLYDSNNEMYTNFVLNEALNRQHLNNLYQGPIMQRKSIEDHIKRSLGTNSTGVRYEIDKPVVTIVVDSTSKILGKGEYTSDSFSMNGARLHARLQEVAGDLINIGPNIKDQVYQVDPSTGKMLFLKMSTLGVMGNVNNKTGKRGVATPANNNFNSMVNQPNVENTATYDQFAKALFALEEHLGDGVYVKLVDAKAIKGNEGGHLINNAISMDDMIANSKSPEGLAKIIKDSSFEKDYENYRIPFNLNKDLSQVPLVDQLAILSTQLQKIVLNGASINDDDGNSAVNEFESKLVQLLKEGMSIEEGDGYEDSKVYNLLMESESLIKGLAKSSEESGKFSLVRLLEAIRNNNKIEGTEQINLLDHPNLKTLAEQYISSKLTKTGVRNQIAGAFVQMIPDYGNNLGWNTAVDAEGKRKDAEIAVPWSMFGKTKEAAQAFLEKSRAEGNPLKAVVVRVPASAEVSAFAAEIKYFTDGTANSAVLPDEFTKMSDADHDADKVFIYRQNIETNEDGSTQVIQDIKTEIFDDLYSKASSPAFLSKQEADLGTDEIKVAVAKVDADLKENWKNESIPYENVDDYSLSSYDDVADVLSKYSFGADAIGIEAIAGKMLSMFAQSGISLKRPVTFKGESYQAFNREQAPQMAKILQAALDLGNDPILLRTGINKHTINAANSMMSLGIPLEEVIRLMKSPVIQKMVKLVDQNTSVFNPKFGDKRVAILEDIKVELAGVKKSGISNMITLKNKKELSDTLFKVGEMYSTADGKGFFVAEVINGKLAPRIVDQSEISTENTQIIDDFIKFDEIGLEVKSMIGLAQIDNQMPTNGVKLANLRNTFKTVNGSDSNDDKLIAAYALLKRPLLKHYNELLKLMSNIEEKQFLTEKKHFDNPAGSYKNASSLLNDPMWIDAVSKMIGNAGSKRTKVEQTIMRMVAAKAINNVDNVGEFVDSMHKEIGDLTKSAKNNFNPPVATTQLEIEMEAAYELMNSKFASRASDAQKEAASEWESRIDNSLELKALYGENLFLKAVKVNKIKTGVNAGRETIAPVKDYRAMTDTVKDEIREDFKRLPMELQEKFVNYQLLHNGVNDKMGSLIDMMPMSENIEYYERLQQQAKNGYTDKQKLNILLALRNDLPQAKVVNNKFTATGWHRTPTGNGVIFTNIGDAVTSVKTTQIRPGKFYDQNNFVKFDLEGVSIEASELSKVEEIKKYCKG